MATPKAPLRVRLTIRVALTVIFAVAMTLAFVVGRLIAAFILLVFLAASIGLLVVHVREGSSNLRHDTQDRAQDR